MHRLVSDEGVTIANSISYRVLIAAARKYGKRCHIGELIIESVPREAPKETRRKTLKQALEYVAPYNYEATSRCAFTGRHNAPIKQPRGVK